MENPYVEIQDGEYLIRNSRVSLPSVVYCWREGLSPESIRDEFPTLTLEQVYGVIAHYLRNQAEIDSHLARLSTDFATRASRQAAAYPEITARLRNAFEISKS